MNRIQYCVFRLCAVLQNAHLQAALLQVQRDAPAHIKSRFALALALARSPRALLLFTSLHFISVTLASFDSIILYSSVQYVQYTVYNLSICTVFLLCYSDLRYTSSLLLLYCTVPVSSHLAYNPAV